MARSLGTSGLSPGCGHHEGPGSDSASATLPGHRAAAGPALPDGRSPAVSPGPSVRAMLTGLRGRSREGAGAGAFPSIPRSSLLAPSANKLRRTEVALGSARFLEAASALAMIRSQSRPLFAPPPAFCPDLSVSIGDHRNASITTCPFPSTSIQNSERARSLEINTQDLSSAQPKRYGLIFISNWVGSRQIMQPSLAHLSSPTPPEPPFPFLELQRQPSCKQVV